MERIIVFILLLGLTKSKDALNQPVAQDLDSNNTSDEPVHKNADSDVSGSGQGGYPGNQGGYPGGENQEGYPGGGGNQGGYPGGGGNQGGYPGGGGNQGGYPGGGGNQGGYPGGGGNQGGYPGGGGNQGGYPGGGGNQGGYPEGGGGSCQDERSCNRFTARACLEKEWLWSKCPNLCDTCKCVDLDSKCQQYVNRCFEISVKHPCRKSCGSCISNWGGGGGSGNHH